MEPQTTTLMMKPTYEDEFTLPVVPRAWARAGSRGAQRFPTKEQKRNKETLAALLLPHRPPRILTGPIVLGVSVYYPIPKYPSWPQWRRDAASRGLWPHTSAPDLSNSIKLIEDVMKGTFFVDDRQICSLWPAPVAMYDTEPRWEIYIAEVALPTRAEIEALRKMEGGEIRIKPRSSPPGIPDNFPEPDRKYEGYPNDALNAEMPKPVCPPGVKEDTDSPPEAPESSGDWWCPRCQDYLSGGLVTFEEVHEGCGCPVIWVEAGKCPWCGGKMPEPNITIPCPDCQGTGKEKDDGHSNNTAPKD